MQKGQTIKVTNQEFISHATLMEMLFGNGNTPDFSGEVLAVNPSAKEYATFDTNFEEAVKAGAVTDADLENSVIYYDKAAGRAFILELNDVELLTLN